MNDGNGHERDVIIVQRICLFEISDENILLFSSQTQFSPKAAIIPFNADNHVISLSSGRKNEVNC